MHKQMAMIDLRRKMLVVSSWSSTTSMLWLINDYFEILEGGATDEVLGAAVGNAFSRSESGLPHPAKPETIPLPVLGELGISKSAYERGIRKVSAVRGDDITFTPWDKRRGHFLPFANLIFSIEREAGAPEIGAATRRALDLAL